MIKSIDTSSYFRLGMPLRWRRPRYKTIFTLLQWKVSHSTTNCSISNFIFLLIKYGGYIIVSFVKTHMTNGGECMPMMKSLFYKWRSMLLIVVILKEDETILDCPRLALFAFNNALSNLNCSSIHYVVYKELLYPSRLVD